MQSLTDADRQAIDLQVAMIHSTLLQFKVFTLTHDVTVGHTAVTYRLLIQTGVRVEKMTRLQESLAYALDASTVRVWRKDGLINVSVPREERRALPDRKSVV